MLFELCSGLIVPGTNGLGTSAKGSESYKPRHELDLNTQSRGLQCSALTTAPSEQPENVICIKHCYQN